MSKHLTINAFESLFPNDKACLTSLLHWRTQGGNGNCLNPHCKSLMKQSFKIMPKKPAFRCRQCNHQFSPFINSYLQNTHLSVRTILKMTFENLYRKTGTPIIEVARTYGCSPNSAARWKENLRLWMSEAQSKIMLDADIVEIDCSYVPTHNKGFGKHYKFKRGRGSEKNSTILCMVERPFNGTGGRTKLFAVPSENSSFVIPLIRKHVSPRSTIYTDSFPAYNTLKNYYTHKTINHNEAFVELDKSTNCAEGLFFHLKCFLRVQRSISPQNLQLFLDEFSYRWSNRFAFDYGLHNLFENNMTDLAEYYSKKYN